MKIPMASTRNFFTVPQEISRALPSDVSIHCLLALDLMRAMDTDLELMPWRKIVPTFSEMKNAFPYFWELGLQDALPHLVKEIVLKQRTRLHRDAGLVLKQFPHVSQEAFEYAWFLINTRTFYHFEDEMKKYPEDDRLALLPLADMFNHADVGCRVTFSTSGYEVLANRKYQKGEEVFISYGEHSNDYLLGEYGFLPAENQWDAICLDETILTAFNETQTKYFKQRCGSGHLMVYTDNTVSPEMLAAVDILCCGTESGQVVRNARRDVGKLSTIFEKVVTDYTKEVKDTWETLRSARVWDSTKYDVLNMRWEQILTKLELLFGLIKNYDLVLKIRGS